MTNIYEKYITEAERLFDEDLIDEAERLLIDILYDEPDFSKAHNHLGWLYLHKKEDWVKAEMHLNFAIKFDPNYAPPYLHLGNLRWKQNKLQEAENFLLIGSEKKDADKSTYFEQIALVNEAGLKYKKAIQFFEKAILESSNSWFVDNCKEGIKRIKKKKSIKFWNIFS
jgi:tetratricopeptide (TPR) repeat protein